jgi:16S rRNA (cytosine1402-N4)-methyltransferase
MKKGNYHESVMVREATESLHINKLANYIDATLGNGGHTLEILRLGGRVLGIELDPEMLEAAKGRIEKEFGKSKSFKLVQGNFESIDAIAKENRWEDVSGILFDLGVSNIHLKDMMRGFSFENPEAPLDMRLNPDSQGVKAADLLNVLREDQVRDLFEVTLEPGAAKWVTGRVLHSRAVKPVETVGDMLEICEGLKTGKHSLSEATLPFLALRIAVNSELTNLKEALPKAFSLLKKEGRLVVISFHSGEDAIVKDFFKEKEKSGGAKLVNYKPITAGTTEIEENRRARSAKMRVLQKI